jgi:hypothetical protein
VISTSSDLVRANKRGTGNMKMKVRLITLLCTFSLGGCTTYAQPNFYNGKYYMAGDDSCRYMRQLEANKVMCSDSSHKDIGYRLAMTNQQLQMYMHQQSINQANAAMYLQYMQQNKPVNCSSYVVGDTVQTYCQ